MNGTKLKRRNKARRVYKAMVNGNVQYTWAASLDEAKNDFRRRALKQYGRAVITDIKIN